jgi:hypothetical protein
MCWRDSLSNREWNLQCGGALGRALVEYGDKIRAERAREAMQLWREREEARVARADIFTQTRFMRER